MDGTPHLQDDPHDRPETAEARQRRLAWEAEMIAEAEAEVAAGQTISLKAVRAWVESWDTDRELPPPEPGQ
jgi:predicted transcriptional regulator